MNAMRHAPINRCNTGRWKADSKESVLFYNDWFLRFAPQTYVQSRIAAIEKVEAAFAKTNSFRKLDASLLHAQPDVLPILRMATIPPLARDRLAGLADVPKALVKSLEEGRACRCTNADLERLLEIIRRLFDKDLMPWLKAQLKPKKRELFLASAIIGDRVCGTLADPLIRNEQERRQLRNISDFLTERAYSPADTRDISDWRAMRPGTFAYHLNIPVKLGRRQSVKIPVDVAIMRKNAKAGDMPLLVECKSAGDFTNTNKRRKEEAAKLEQLKATYGGAVEFVLFLCGYFDSGYLGYEAAEGIDWVWEHRISDLEKAGV